MQLDEIISLCCKQDARAWKVTSRQLLRRVPAKKYTVIVPDRELDFFRQITPAEFNIDPQSQYAQPFENKFSQMASIKIPNKNWYIQQ